MLQHTGIPRAQSFDLVHEFLNKKYGLSNEEIDGVMTYLNTKSVEAEVKSDEDWEAARSRGQSRAGWLLGVLGQRMQP